MYVFTFDNISTEGDDIQPQAPVDSAFVPQTPQEGSCNKRPGDEIGVFSFSYPH
jgi:hypothetical protein